MSLHPFKLQVEVVACEKNDDGQIVGERNVGRVVVYEPDFDRIAELLREEWWPQILAAEGQPTSA